MVTYGQQKKYYCNSLFEVGEDMVSKKGKRKFEYEGKSFYWFIRTNDVGILKIHILSNDKKINLEYPMFDSEVPVTPSYIKKLLDDYFLQAK